MATESNDADPRPRNSNPGRPGVSLESVLEAQLNPQQMAAVTHQGGPQLVIAGAGSGKTRVITYRIAWLVREAGVDPSAIAALTFTNKAAAEMRERTEDLLGIYPLPAFVGTFHRLALRLLRRYAPKVGLPRDFTILDSSDQLKLVKQAQKAAQVPEDSFRPRAVLGAISTAKNQLVGPARFNREADDFFSRKVAAVYQHYQSLLRESSAVDFDDMIRHTVNLLKENDGIRRRVQEQWPHLLVDEFQDTNHAQLELVKAVAGRQARLTAVGDEDQSIYRWRGADLRNILRFEESFPDAEIRKLEQNYRSTQTILDASGAVVARNENRRGKNLWTEAGSGDKITLFRARDEHDEARWIIGVLQDLDGEDHGEGGRFAWSDMAVLLRTNAQTRALEEELLRRGLSYNLVAGVRFYERAEVKDVVAYLRLIENPDDALSFERVLNRPTRGIGKTTRAALHQIAERAKLSPWQALQDDARLARLSPRARKALVRFRTLILELRHLAEDLPLPSLLRHLFEATGFADQFDLDDEDGRSRLENLQELLSAAQDFTDNEAYRRDAENEGHEGNTLAAFLDHVALTADTDSLGGPGLSLMTLHSAKGLEFGAVVIAGLEEGLLPHFNAQSHPDDLEEERRLLYVGMTRAEKRLFLTACRRRRVAGKYQDQHESRFLAEIPGNHLRVEHSPELFAGAGQGSGGRYGGSRYGGGGGRGGGGGGGGGYAGSSGRSQRSSSTTSSGSSSSRAIDDVYAFLGRQSPDGGPGKASETSEASETSTHTSPKLKDPPATNLHLPFSPETPRGGVVAKGKRVRHAKLGVGKVLSVEGSGDDAKLLVYFEGVGRRKLIAKYANLDVL